MKKKFNKEYLLDILDNSEELNDKIVSNSRWSIMHEIVFKEKETGKHWSVIYSVGATESQEETPFEYDEDEIECTEVELQEVTIKKWLPIKEL